jgi:AraC-like DNA-binding protein
MFPVLARAITPGEHVVPDVGANSLVASLLSLLDLAGAEMEKDAEKAKLTIWRASSMLRTELERNASPMVRENGMGELAAWQLRRVRTYIDDHISERIYVRDLGAVARRSTAHFCRAFKCTMGETPHSYITRRRLDRAQWMMLTGDDSLSQIALQCGFSDQAHFCNRFRHATGESPAAWRRERLEVSRTDDVADRLTAINCL